MLRKGDRDGRRCSTTRLDDDDRPFSPEESLALIARQRHQVAARLEVNPVLRFLIWGVAYLAGFGLLALSYGPAAPLDLPTAVTVAVPAVLLVLAMVGSAVYGSRVGRGVRGPRVAGAMYGWTWFLAFVGLWAVNAGISRLVDSPEVTALLWSGTSVLIVGVLYLATGAMFGDRATWVLGVWFLVVGATSVFAGVPGNFVVLSLAGGGGMLAQAGILAARRSRRA